MTSLKKIKSKNNSFYGLLKSLNTKKYRIINQKYLVEGVKMCQEAVKEEKVEKLIFTESSACFIEMYFNGIDEDRIVIFDDLLFEQITRMQNSEGVIALINMEKEIQEFSSKKLLCLDGIKDPGNMGTIIRSAEAFGFNEIILTNNCVDIYNSKSLRASMGSIFRCTFASLDVEEIAKLKNDYTFYTTALEDSVELGSVPIEARILLIIGSESHGVSNDFINLADHIIKIPMHGKVESLNAGVAASITMYSLKS